VDSSVGSLIVMTGESLPSNEDDGGPLPLAGDKLSRLLKPE
jgi:hypothetical protein